MRFIIAAVLALGFLPNAKASSLPKDLELTLSCYANCERGFIQKINGQWVTVNGPVKTFGVRITKKGDAFKMYASQVAVTGAPVNATVTVNYTAKINDDGVISDSFMTGTYSVGKLTPSGELEFKDQAGNCAFKSRPDLGAGVLDISCMNGTELDFSGLALVTDRK